MNSISRLLTKIKVEPNTNCWEWTSTIMKGYGKFKVKRKFMLAHRFVYELFKGSIPEGLTIDHLCRNRKCVNPDHLEAVTNRENILRGKGLAAINARKTHCPKNHEYTKDNTYIDLYGKRRCMKCRSKS